jgi:hypothetical protein
MATSRKTPIANRSSKETAGDRFDRVTNEVESMVDEVSKKLWDLTR